MKDDESGWLASVNVDLMATVRSTQAAIPFLEKAGGGTIINISSISGFRAVPRSLPYAAVKAALVNYTKGQGLALAPKRIRVNAIAPGSIEFPGGAWERSQEFRSGTLPAHAQQHTVGAVWDAGGDRKCCHVPRERFGELGDRPNHNRRRRTVAELNRCLVRTGHRDNNVRSRQQQIRICLRWPSLVLDGRPPHAACRRHNHHRPAAACSIFAITWSIEKLPGFCLGGNSLNVSRNFAT